MTTAPRWTHFHHGADIGVRGYGPTRAAAFEQAGIALTAVITEPNQVRPLAAVAVACEAPDDELLFADWLNRIVFEMATRHMLFSRFVVELEDHRLAAELWGETVDMTRHEPAVEIKGATYTELCVGQNAEGLWHAGCVVDV